MDTFRAAIAIASFRSCPGELWSEETLHGCGNSTNNTNQSVSIIISKWLSVHDLISQYNDNISISWSVKLNKQHKPIELSSVQNISAFFASKNLCRVISARRKRRAGMRGIIGSESSRIGIGMDISRYSWIVIDIYGYFFVWLHDFLRSVLVVTLYILLASWWSIRIFMALSAVSTEEHVEIILGSLSTEGPWDEKLHGVPDDAKETFLMDEFIFLDLRSSNSVVKTLGTRIQSLGFTISIQTQIHGNVARLDMENKENTEGLLCFVVEQAAHTPKMIYLQRSQGFRYREMSWPTWKGKWMDMVFWTFREIHPVRVQTKLHLLRIWHGTANNSRMHIPTWMCIPVRRCFIIHI